MRRTGIKKCDDNHTVFFGLLATNHVLSLLKSSSSFRKT